MDNPSVRFCLGKVVATPGALAALQSAGERVESRLARHQSGDFGELDPQDVSEQATALQHENDPGQRQRMMSAYLLRDGTVIWIITEADRSSTCILLPEEY
jgi:hypothetical protein